jgi:hypothetical protein
MVETARTRNTLAGVWLTLPVFHSEVMMNARLSQNKAGYLTLAGHVLKTGEDVEVIVGGNWHRALVHKNKLWAELILDNGKFVAGVGLKARLPMNEAFDSESLAKV